MIVRSKALAEIKPESVCDRLIKSRKTAHDPFRKRTDMAHYRPVSSNAVSDLGLPGATGPSPALYESPTIHPVARVNATPLIVNYRRRRRVMW
jgi:hypothetical protein